MQGHVVTLVAEIPADGIEFIFLMQEFDRKFIFQHGSNLVEELEIAIIGNDDFSATHRGS
jgi:hypothetical protein